MIFQRNEPETIPSNKDWSVFLTETKSGIVDQISEKDKSLPKINLTLTKLDQRDREWLFIENPLQLEYISFELCRSLPESFCISDISFENVIRIPSMEKTQNLYFKSRSCKESGPSTKRDSFCGPWNTTDIQAIESKGFRQNFFWDQYLNLIRIKESGTLNIELLKTFLTTEFKSFNFPQSHEKVILLKHMIREFLRENHEISLLALSESGSTIPWKVIAGSFGSAFLKFDLDKPDFSTLRIRSPDLLQNLEDICQDRPILNYCSILTIPDESRQEIGIQKIIKKYQFFIGTDAAQVPSTGETSESFKTYLRYASEHRFFARLPMNYSDTHELQTCFELLPESVCTDPIAIWSISRDLRGTMSTLNQHFLMSRAITLMILNLKNESSLGVWIGKYLKNLNNINSQYDGMKIPQSDGNS